MVINNNYRRFDVKEIAIDKLEEKIGRKCKTFKTDNLWFEKPIGSIMSVSYRHGYFTLITKEGKTVFPRYIKGYNMIEMIKTIDENRIFFYIETDGKHLKIRPKNRK